MTIKFLLTAAGMALALGSSATYGTEFTFKYGNSQPEKAARSQSMVYFKEQLEQRSDGRIEVQNYFSAVLGTEKEMMDQVTTGLLQGTRGGFFNNANSQYNIYLLPFLVSGWDEMQCLVASDFTKQVQANAAANGYHIPATGISQGFRMYTNNILPITQVSDLKGLKIREPQVDLFIKTGEALGSTPIAMAFSEVYQAFQQGVIDGQHNPPANIWNYKVHEVQKYLSVTNHMTGPDPLLVNKAWYDNLPTDLQQVFDEVAVDALAHSDKLARQAEVELLAKLNEVMEVNYLTDAAVNGFRDAVKPVYQQMIDQGYFSQDALDAAKAAAQSCN